MEMEMHDLTPVVLVTGLAHTEAARLAEVCCSSVSYDLYSDAAIDVPTHQSYM